MPAVNRSDCPYPLRTVDGEVSIEGDSLVINGTSTFNGPVTIDTIELGEIICGSVAAAGSIEGSTIASTGLLHGAVIKSDNLTPQEITYADTFQNLQSIPSSTSGFVLTSNGASAPSFQAPTPFVGVLPIANGGTGSASATGSGQTVLATAPSLVDPFLGDAEANTLHTTGNIGCDAKIFTNELRVLSTSANSAVQTNGLKDLVTVSNTGTGSNVMSTSPTLVTPILGAASATSLSLGTALGVANGGTGQTSLSAVTVGNATSAVTATNVAGGANGSLVVQTGVGASGFLAVGTNGQRLISNGTTPVWANQLPLKAITSFITTPYTFSANDTLTAAEFCSGIWFQSGAAAGVTLTFPSAASIIAILGSTTNTFMYARLFQLTTQRTMTFVAGAGMTFQNIINVTNGLTFNFLIQVTSGTTVTVTMSNS